MAKLTSITIDDTGYLTLPAGTTAQRVTNASTVTQFTTVGTTTWTCPAGVTEIEVLVVGGGGGGGSQVGGGGGGGGVIYRPSYPVAPGTVYSVTVGGGGAGTTSTSARGANGGDSVFNDLTALGGGGGGSHANNGVSSSGGSGGGGGGGVSGNVAGSAGTAGQGFAGGNGQYGPTAGYWTGGGGGGAGGPGGNGGFSTSGGAGSSMSGAVVQNGVGGFGGPGVFYNISGQERAYGGGGAGCSDSSIAVLAQGGSGVGGSGWSTSYYFYSKDGVANTGGGGGGVRDYVSANGPGGNGGSGIVIVRYNTSDAAGAEAGSVRINTTNNSLEYLTGGGQSWSQNTMPFLTRTIISTHYVGGGYKDAVAWTNVNRCVANTDTTTNLGDSSLEAAHNYHAGGCSKNIYYTFGAPNAHGTASNYIIGFNMRTEQQYTSAGSRNMAVSTIYAGVAFKEHYTAFISQGGYGGEVEEFNMITETLVGNCGVSRTAEAGWAMSDENYAIFYGSDSNSQNFHFATKTLSVRPGTHPSSHHQQKSVQSKIGKAWAGNEGSYNGGNNYRITNFVTNVTSGTVAKPTTNMGEENYTMGQEWQYCLGQYNGSGQVNVSHKFYYATQAGAVATSTLEPKGHAGMSSATTGWRD